MLRFNFLLIFQKRAVFGHLDHPRPVFVPNHEINIASTIACISTPRGTGTLNDVPLVRRPPCALQPDPLSPMLAPSAL
jgi:hypothetical protein